MYRASSSAKAASKSSRSNTTSRHDPIVGVDLDDVEGFILESPRGHGPTRELVRAQGVRRESRGRSPWSSRSRHQRSPACLSMSASRPRKTPAFTTRRRSSTERSRPLLEHGAQSPAAKYEKTRSMHTRCGVLQPRCRRVQLLEPRDRGVEVCLVEYLAAVDHVAFDRQNADHPPLGVEALLRGPMRHGSDDRSEVVQPMHSLDGAARRRVRSHERECMSIISPGANDDPRRWSIFTQSGVVARQFAPIERGVAPAR